MKTVFALLSLIATIGIANAGGFGGPPPFTNGSPLISGVDGSYQATARGSNLVGVFRFTYANGRQVSLTNSSTVVTTNSVLTDPYNDYVFFVGGVSYRGLVQANINQANIDGVLDNGGVNIPNGTDFQGDNPVGLTTFMSGNFGGTIQQDSSDYFFKGSGQAQTWFQQGDSANPGDFVPGSLVSFKFKGIRATLNTSGAESSTGT